MKINGSDGYTPIQNLIQRVKSQQDIKGSQPQAQGQTVGEKVEISPQAREIQKLKEILEQMPEVRLERVEELKSMIQEGKYKVDLEKLSDRILEALLLGEI
ncbi:MAG: flagellar biosynthesis anti-sigma factor FlgM [bacterium]